MQRTALRNAAEPLALSATHRPPTFSTDTSPQHIVGDDLTKGMAMVLSALKVCVVASMTIAGIASAEVEVRPKIRTTDYDNVSLNELISVFTRSYVGAGFKLRDRKRTVTNVGTQNVTRLVFDIANPEHPRKKKGIVSFLIVSTRGVKRCSPCTVHGEIFGGLADASEYDEKEYGDFMAIMVEANRKAQAAIRAELGKSLAHVKSLKRAGGDI